MKGWHKESYRHYLAAKGVVTNKYFAKNRYAMAKWDSLNEKKYNMVTLQNELRADVDRFINQTDARNVGSAGHKLNGLENEFESQVKLLKRMDLVDANESGELAKFMGAELDRGREHIKDIRDAKNVGRSEYSKHQEKAGVYVPERR